MIRPRSIFSTAADSDFEVVRLPVVDEVHRPAAVSSRSGPGIIVVGFDEADSCACTGGMGTGIINPIVVI